MKYKIKDVEESLERFVALGILEVSEVNGEKMWKNNPEFDKKPKAEQDKILDLATQSN